LLIAAKTSYSVFANVAIDLDRFQLGYVLRRLTNAGFCDSAPKKPGDQRRSERRPDVLVSRRRRRAAGLAAGTRETSQQDHFSRRPLLYHVQVGAISAMTRTSVAVASNRLAHFIGVLYLLGLASQKKKQ